MGPRPPPQKLQGGPSKHSQAPLPWEGIRAPPRPDTVLPPLCRGCTGGPSSLTPSPKLASPKPGIWVPGGQAAVPDVVRGGQGVVPVPPPRHPTLPPGQGTKGEADGRQRGRRDTPATPRHPASTSGHPTAPRPQVRESSSLGKLRHRQGGQAGRWLIQGHPRAPGQEPRRPKSHVLPCLLCHPAAAGSTGHLHTLGHA